ncbi:hypothetical protein ACFPRL_33040 [Pseudoclavibacter helvolus]
MRPKLRAELPRKKPPRFALSFATSCSTRELSLAAGAMTPSPFGDEDWGV